jgi:hypothetical protein
MNNDSDPVSFCIHLFSETIIHMPGIFIQNLSEYLIHMARNPQPTMDSQDSCLSRVPRRPVDRQPWAK